MQGRQQGSDRGLEIRFRFRGPGRHHNSLGIAHQGGEFLGIGGPQVHQLHLGIRLADAVGNGLADPIGEAVLA